jgi:hypothetical protein
MSIPLDLVQFKNGPVTVRERLQRARNSNAIQGTPEPIIMPTVLALCDWNAILLTGIIQRDLRGCLSSKMHKGCGHSDTMQPCGQSRFATKRRELSEHLNENVLGQVVRFRSVLRHAKDYCIDPVFV